jgi:hypothetical protein
MNSQGQNSSFQSILDEKMGSAADLAADGKAASNKPDTPSNSTNSIDMDILDIAWVYRGLASDLRAEITVSVGGIASYPQSKTEETRALQREKWIARLSITQSAAARFFFERGENLFWMDSSGRKLTSSYRKLAKKLHPDRHHSASESVKKCYAQQFNSLHEAYQILRNSPLGMGR